MKTLPHNSALKLEDGNKFFPAILPFRIDFVFRSTIEKYLNQHQALTKRLSLNNEEKGLQPSAASQRMGRRTNGKASNCATYIIVTIVMRSITP